MRSVGKEFNTRHNIVCIAFLICWWCSYCINLITGLLRSWLNFFTSWITKFLASILSNHLLSKEQELYCIVCIIFSFIVSKQGCKLGSFSFIFRIIYSPSPIWNLAPYSLMGGRKKIVFYFEENGVTLKKVRQDLIIFIANIRSV
jgi:hypothetical protein